MKNRPHVQLFRPYTVGEAIDSLSMMQRHAKALELVQCAYDAGMLSALSKRELAIQFMGTCAALEYEGRKISKSYQRALLFVVLRERGLLEEKDGMISCILPDEPAPKCELTDDELLAELGA